jgi:hypothetical protein
MTPGQKSGADVVAVSTSALAYFKAIPWPELAACAAFLWTVLRIGEMVYGWWKKK